MRTNLAIGPFLLFANSLHLLVDVVLFVGRIKVLEVLLIPTFRNLIKTKQEKRVLLKMSIITLKKTIQENTTRTFAKIDQPAPIKIPCQ
ncbi:hypothetical protein ACJIZ3_008835 [Penstemon smallii]|uniref:Secreted protein n=1 Tax=Penstemon smallii TaxID=265156 RepID=A0ABD3TAX1_9LAMI